MEDNLHESQPEISPLESVTAPSKVFAIPELIEMVFVHLPALDVLFCQGINRTCRGVISKSGALKEKLFYECDLAEDPKHFGGVDHLLWLETNPFIGLLHRRQVLARQKKKEVDDHSLEKLHNVEASWKNMYLTRPALCTIETRKKGTPPNSGHRSNIRLSKSDGIRMHHLHEMDLSKLMLPFPHYCIRCIGALASNKDKKFEKIEQITRLHLNLGGYQMTPP